MEHSRKEETNEGDILHNQVNYGAPPTSSQPPVYAPPTFPDSNNPQNNNYAPSYSPYPPAGYPPQSSYPPQAYQQPYPQQPYPQQAYPPQAYPQQPYPAPSQAYAAQAYPPQPYPNGYVPPPTAASPVIMQSGSHVHGPSPLPCGGIGVAWILFIIGWFLGLTWAIGAFYTCVGDPRERRGGRACLIMLIIWIAIIIFLSIN